MRRRTLLTGGAATGAGLLAFGATARAAHAGPIGSGWTEVSSSYRLHVPPNRTRHEVTNGVHHFWLYDTDPSTFPGSDSGPRSELRFLDEYTSGHAQFECEIRIASGAHLVSVMQVFGGSTRATAFMALAMNTNSLNHYGSASRQIYAPVYNTWLRLNVVHETDIGKVHVFVNRAFRATYADGGRNTHYFKCGIYGRDGMSARTDVYIRNVHLYRKSAS